MTAPHRNLELKLRCAHLAAARQAAERLGARAGGIEVQTDTYFLVSRGQLKLREIEGGLTTLICYDRADERAARISAYHLVPVADAPAMKALLGDALGVRGEVHKRREIWFWHNVRIHLDEVRGLGSFVEFEAVLSPADDETTARDRLNHMCQALAIDAAERVATSYADLLRI